MVDPLTQARLGDIVMPVILRGEEKEDRVFDLEPLIDYMVFELQRQQKKTCAVLRHPCVDGQTLTLEDIEAVTGEGVDEKNEAHVKLVLADFQADMEGFFQKRVPLTEAEVNAKAGEVVCVTEEWKRVSKHSSEEVAVVVDAFLKHVQETYGANAEVGDAKSLHECIQAVVGDEHEAYRVMDAVEQLLDANVEVNVISDYNHDTQTRIYIFNPDAETVERVQKREMAAQRLLVVQQQQHVSSAGVEGGDGNEFLRDAEELNE